MIIRKYEERDLIEIVKLFYDTVHIINKKDYNQKQLDAWAPKQYDLAKWNLSLSKSYTLVAVENDKIVGFGNIYPDGYLDCLYVHSEFQNQHIATKLCDLLEEKVTGDIIVYASITAKLFFLNRNYESLKENYVEKNGVILKNFLMKKNQIITCNRCISLIKKLPNIIVCKSHTNNVGNSRSKMLV